ncbi:MAG: winged helix-turn-helix transcriptional regulator [Clostridia bacterium]|nr:winged helix-turn-helix transcriptional regulator [Clostridia bacterium]
MAPCPPLDGPAKSRHPTLAEAREAGLTPVQAQTLLFVRDTKSFATSVGNLARHLGATHASTVGVVDGLVARGLLRREADPRDRRSTLLRLTDAGRRAADRLERWGHLLGEALAALPVEERGTLERGLGAVIWALRAAGHLEVAEPCRGCAHFRENAAPGSPEPHRCNLLQAFLSEEEARKYCPDFTPAEA